MDIIKLKKANLSTAADYSPQSVDSIIHVERK